MSQIKIERYTLRNLDCGSCAAKIERELLKTAGVEEAVVDFANLTLHLKAADIPKALEAINRIEPEVVVTPKAQGGRESEPHDHSESGGYRKELVFIGIAGVILVVQLLFEDRFHALAWPAVEYVTALVAYLLVGWNVLLGAARTVRRGEWFDENVLMVIATLGAIAIHALAEAVGVMLFFKVGELLQNLAVSKSRRSVRAILAARPDRALVKTDSGFVETVPSQVNVGDIILVKPGEKVALDGEVVEGISQIDASPLTGEPVPIQVRPGEPVMAGTINTSAALMVRATKPFESSSIARVLELVENAAARKATTEKFITTFARYYTPAVVAGAAAIALLPPLVISDALFSTWIYRALVLLVISCPCALVISIPLGYFGGIGRASHNGILIKGSMFIDALAKVKTVVFDKTGTLTRGVFTVDQVVPDNGYTADDLLRYAAAAELHSTHPIGKSILQDLYARGLEFDEAQVREHHAIPGRGVSATYQGKKILVGNDPLLHENGIDHTLCVFDGTVAHVIVDDQYAGYVLIGDQLKPDAVKAMEALRANGVSKLMMLTGDNECTAAGVARTLKLDAFHAELLPEDKVRIFEEISLHHQKDEKVAFVGDGINDAPVLARADVGVAMGGLGSDAAIETADVVLMTDSPLKMAKAVIIARDTRRIVKQNIVLALSVKGLFMLLGAVGMATMWEAVFADMGTALLALLNATRTLHDSTD
ncbi:MAG: cadmium-translocating P-type ATPase [Desulfuromonadales bacterium]|nr:cadmium-translocating P-type ATPase [Desulfuromonadales bacterium]